MRITMRIFRQSGARSEERGIALILVMLAILILSTLAAAMVFSARTETYASYNFRIGTEAENVSRAGVQRALNFLQSSNYASVNPLDTSTYNVSNTYVLPSATGTSCGSYVGTVSPYATEPVCLYYTNGSPVECQPGVSNCSAQSPVTLGSSSNYPAAAYTDPHVDVATNWKNMLINQTVSDGLGGTGTYSVTAELVKYKTVNNGQFGTGISNCPSGDPDAGAGVCRSAQETWQVTSTGTWNSNAMAAGGVEPTVTIVATIAPMYDSFTGDAFYGLCNVTFNGGGCTDSYSSGSGAYNGSGGVNSCATSSSGSSSNATYTGAGIGSNGGLSVPNSAGASIGGTATFANNAGSSSCDTGFSGKASNVTGGVEPGPAIPPPSTFNDSTWTCNPTMSCAPSVTSSSSVTTLVEVAAPGQTLAVTNIPPSALPACTAALSAAGLTSAGGYVITYLEPTATITMGSTYSYSYGSGATCSVIPGNGTASYPYVIGNISSTKGAVNIVAPEGAITNPTYISTGSVYVGTNGDLVTSYQPPYPYTGSFPATTTSGGFPLTGNETPSLTSPLPGTNSQASPMILDVTGNITLKGTSDLNFNPSNMGVPSPMYLTLNVGSMSSVPTPCNNLGPAVSLSGQSQLSAELIAPNSPVTLGGSGSTGAMFGSVLGCQITDSGHYPVHYDRMMSSLSGKQFSVQVVSVSRNAQ